MADFESALMSLLGPCDEGLICTTDGNIAFMSDKAKALLGDFTGRPADSLLDAACLELAAGALITTRLAGVPVSVSATVYEGWRMYYVQSLLVPEGYIQLGAQEEGELRTCLSNLFFAADGVLRAAADGPMRHSAEVVKHSCSQIERTLLNNSTLGRLLRGDLKPRLQAVDVGGFLRTLIEPVEAPARQRGVTVTLEASDGLYAQLDGELIALMVLNLLSNSLRSAFRNGTVLVRAERRGENIAIHVEDNGHGMDAAALQGLFKRGTGLRLASEIARAHGGSLLVETGGGVHVCCVLPSCEVERDFKSAEPLSPLEVFHRVMVQLSTWLGADDYDYRLF